MSAAEELQEQRQPNVGGGNGGIEKNEGAVDGKASDVAGDATARAEQVSSPATEAEAAPKDTTTIIDEITGPEVGFKEGTAVSLTRPSIKPQARKPTNRERLRTFDEMVLEEEQRKMQMAQPRRESLVNQEFSDPLGILEEFKKAKESFSIAEEATAAQAALFAAKAAERKAKAEQDKAAEEERKRRAQAAFDAGTVLIEGELLKKTKTGQWHTRRFQIVRNEIIWLRSDNVSTYSLNLAVDGASVRDVKIGVKKNMFEIIVPSPGFNLMLSASSEEEKKRWMEAIQSTISGPRPPPGASSSTSGKPGNNFFFSPTGGKDTPTSDSTGVNSLALGTRVEPDDIEGGGKGEGGGKRASFVETAKAASGGCCVIF